LSTKLTKKHTEIMYDDLSSQP